MHDIHQLLLDVLLQVKLDELLRNCVAIVITLVVFLHVGTDVIDLTRVGDGKIGLLVHDFLTVFHEIGDVDVSSPLTAVRFDDVNEKSDPGFQ